MRFLVYNSLYDQVFSYLHAWFIFLTIFLLCFSSHVDAFASSVTTRKLAEQVEESTALLTWKASLDSQCQSLLLSWTGSSPCNNWIGIRCNEAGNVAHVNLTSFGLKGTLHNLNFSPFPQLLSLCLFDNSLYGIIPSSIGSLSELTYLTFSANLLSGKIPAEIG